MKEQSNESYQCEEICLGISSQSGYYEEIEACRRAIASLYDEMMALELTNDPSCNFEIHSISSKIVDLEGDITAFYALMEREQDQAFKEEFDL